MVDVLRSLFLSVPLIGAFAIFALGIVVIYRASRVLNLAHGAMAMLPAYLNYSLVAAGVPIGISVVLAVISGALLGVGVERVFVRRLRPQGPTAQTVGTVAVAALAASLAARVWGTTPILAPQVFPEGTVTVAGASIRIGDLGLLATGLAVSAAMFAFFTYTELGLAMRGAAQNRHAAALMGIDPDRAAASAWALGGGLAALAGVLLAAVTNLDPYTLSLQVLPAFVAALIGGLEAMAGAVVGAIVVGAVYGLVPLLAKIPLLDVVLVQPGAPQLVLTVLALAAMAIRGKRVVGVEAAEAGLAAGRSFGQLGRQRIGPWTIIAVVALLLLPWVVSFAALGTALLAIQLALVALSLVVLIGWVGQISLGQAAFVGVGALVSAMVTRAGLEFPASMIVGAATAGVVAVLLGAVALRVRGLYLAVATLIFAWMAEAFLFRSPWLGAVSGGSSIPNQYLGTPGGIPSFDLGNRRVLYLILLAVLVLVVAAMANVRDTRTGRAFFAVRGSEMAAASLGIDVTRTKLIAFGISGVLAGLGGTLIMLEQRTVVADSFFVAVGLQFLAIAVVGGLTSLSGAVAAGILFAGLNLLFFEVAALSGWLDVVSGGLLAFVLLVYPGGLAAAPEAIRRRWAARRARAAARASAPDDGDAVAPGDAEEARGWRPWRTRAAVPERPDDWFDEVVTRDDETVAPSGPKLNGHAPAPRPTLAPDRAERRPLLEADAITVRFGGLTAVSDATLKVCEGEVVGLIGPNGAGKTTLFNAVLGLNDPAGGQVRLYGRDVAGLPPHLRARLGVARTFQVLQLFNELSVFDNLLVATHLHNDAGVASNLAATPRTIAAERRSRDRVDQVLDLLGLHDVAHKSVRNLSFGVLRLVELGRALVTGAKLMMLDEAASGLNNAETDRLVEVVRGVRDLGVSVLLIEHDVPMVVGVSDHVYVLDQGVMIAEGDPGQVQRDPKVIAAYLGGADPDEAGHDRVPIAVGEEAP